MSEEQRRHFTRIPFNSICRISSLDNSQSWSASLIDLSLHGVLTSRPDNLSVSRGNELMIELSLNDNELVIMMEAQVAHVSDDVIGLECRHIDVDSLSHLRKILELNLGDVSLVEREIGEIVDINKH